MQSKGVTVSKRLALTLCVVGMAATVVPLAEAHIKSIPSQHQMGFTPDVASDVFTGTVSSAAGACERNRSINLFRQGPATSPSLTRLLKRRSRTRMASGHGVSVTCWKAATTPWRRERWSSARVIGHICDAAKSNTVTVEVDPADQDGDGDGFTPNQGDCDDADIEVFPGQTEIETSIDDRYAMAM